MYLLLCFSYSDGLAVQLHGFLIPGGGSHHTSGNASSSQGLHHQQHGQSGATGVKLAHLDAKTDMESKWPAFDPRQTRSTLCVKSDGRSVPTSPSGSVLSSLENPMVSTNGESKFMIEIGL